MAGQKGGERGEKTPMLAEKITLLRDSEVRGKITLLRGNYFGEGEITFVKGKLFW